MKIKSSPAMLALLLVFGWAAHLEVKAQLRQVILHEGERQNGVSRKYPIGKWYLGGAEAFDNRASSMTVPDGYSVAVCDNSVNPEFVVGGKNPDACTRFPEGVYEFHNLNKKISFIVVEQFEISKRDCIVCLYSGQVGRGYLKPFKTVGTFSLNEHIGYRSEMDGNKAPQLGNSTTSLWVAPGYTATVKAMGVPKTYQTGLFNLSAGFNNHISELTISKSSIGIDASKKVVDSDVIKAKPKPLRKLKSFTVQSKKN